MSPVLSFKSMKKLILLFFTISTSTGVFAQFNNLKALGDKAFKEANYYQAAYYYKAAAGNMRRSIPFYSAGKSTKEKITGERLYVTYRLAESYRLYHDYKDAGDWYGKILNENSENIYPLARL